MTLTSALLAARDADIGEIAYILLLFGGILSLLAAAYVLYARRDVVIAVALAILGIVMIVLAT